MLDTLNTMLLFPGNTSDPAELDRALRAIETEALLTPTHASFDERTRLPYDRARLCAPVQGRAGGNPVLWRTKVPKYSHGFLSANQASHNHVSADYGGAGKISNLPKLFDAWTALAGALRVEFGFIHLLFDPESEEYDGGVRVPLKSIRRYGLASLHARNWFGPSLLGVIGKERLLSLPNATETPWGGVQLDLAPAPWLADFATLLERQRELARAFEQWGVLADHSDFEQTKAGPAWVPPAWEL